MSKFLTILTSPSVISSCIALIFGTLFGTCILQPIISSYYFQKNVYYQNKLNLAEQISNGFIQYRLCRQRLILVSGEEAKGNARGWKLDKEFFVNKESYRACRDKYRDKLYENLQLMPLYFNDRTCKLAKQFIIWDSKFKGKLPQFLPSDKIIYAKQSDFVTAMRKELQK